MYTLPLWRRVCRVLANEGASGIARRIGQEMTRGRAIDTAVAAQRHRQRIQDFAANSHTLNSGDLSRYYWYHTVDLGNGVVTPGDYDYRDSLPVFQFPAAMQGMHVLDVGSATGFFSFEFERRGATVTSVDLPSIADWDIPHCERDQTLRQLMESQRATSVEELTYLHIEGPFQVCRTALGSKVQRCRSSIYDLTPEKLGRGRFDMVFAGDILLHTFSPLAALNALSSLCGDLLVVTLPLPAVGDQPVMLFTGAARDRRTWWHPGRVCLEQMLTRVGFRSVQQVGQHVVVGRGGEWVNENVAVFHARR